MRDALFEAGCRAHRQSTSAARGTRRGPEPISAGAGTDPSSVQPGREERVAELRLETVFPEDASGRGRRRTASLRIPYEEPAFDSIPPVKARLHGRRRARQSRPAAYGYVLEADDGHVLAAHGETIGARRTTSPSTAASSPAWRRPRSSACRELEVVSDSELLVKQMQGEYRVKNEALRELWEEATDLERRFAQGALHGRAPGPQRAGRPARQRGPGRRRPEAILAAARM